MIQIQAIGNVGRDPERKSFDNGESAVYFPVAVNMRSNDRDSTEWITVKAAGKLGDICMQYLRKGRKVYVQGRPRAFSYRNQIEEIVTRLEIKAGVVEFLTNAAAEDPTPSAAPAEQAGQSGFIAVNEDLPF